MKILRRERQTHNRQEPWSSGHGRRLKYLEVMSSNPNTVSLIVEFHSSFVVNVLRHMNILSVNKKSLGMSIIIKQQKNFPSLISDFESNLF